MLRAVPKIIMPELPDRSLRSLWAACHARFEFFSRQFEIFDGEVCVANLDLSEYVPGTQAFFSVSAIQGRTFEIFREEYNREESWGGRVKGLVQGTDEPPTLLREDGRTIVSAKRLDCNSDKSSFEVVFDQTVYELNPVNMSLLDRLATGIYIHIPLKLPPFELWTLFPSRKRDRVVGSIHPARRWLTRKAIVELPEYLPLEVQVFIAGLVLCRWVPNIDHRGSE